MLLLLSDSAIFSILPFMISVSLGVAWILSVNSLLNLRHINVISSFSLLSLMLCELSGSDVNLFRTLMMRDYKEFIFYSSYSLYSAFIKRKTWLRASIFDFWFMLGFTLALKSYLQHFALSSFSNIFSKNLLIDWPISTFFNSKSGRIFYSTFGRHSSIKPGKMSTDLFSDTSELSSNPGFFSSKWSRAIAMYFLALLFA